jgi:hypothetical protein
MQRLNPVADLKPSKDTSHPAEDLRQIREDGREIELMITKTSFEQR